MLLLGAARVDARVLRLFGPVLYLASLVGLLAVFVIGSTINGAHAWIVIGGGFEIQPAEFAKLGLIAALAVLFGQRAAGRRAGAAPSGRDLLAAGLLVLPPLGLIMLQPDLGSALVLLAATLGVLHRGRRPGAAGSSGCCCWACSARCWRSGPACWPTTSWPGSPPSPTPAGIRRVSPTTSTRRTSRSRTVACSARDCSTARRPGGRSSPSSRPTSCSRWPARSWAFSARRPIIGLFAVVLWRGLRIAAQATGAQRLVAAGIVCWIGFQAFQNIGMNLGLTPVTGLPLPFVSYGGSSMFAQGLALGLLQAIHRRTST